MQMTGRPVGILRLAGTASLTASTLLMLTFVLGAPGHTTTNSALHYAPNGNFDSSGNYLPSKVGFNIADVGNVSQLNALKAGVKGLVWVGQCNGVDSNFLNAVRPYIGNPKLFGFFLMDDPDPRVLSRTAGDSHRCAADDLKAESDWIHANVPGAKTFIVLMNLSSSEKPSFFDTYNPTNSHVDLFGLDPYPCRTELNGCEYDMIDRYVTAAESWGIPRRSMVPVYQAFGGGHWMDDAGGQYTLPTVSEERQILTRWRRLVEAPVFDFAYSWGSQNADSALEGASDLQILFSVHNHANGAGSGQGG